VIRFGQIFKNGVEVISVNVKAKNLKRYCNKRGLEINAQSRAMYVMSITQY
jgi:hypothetical protein